MLSLTAFCEFVLDLCERFSAKRSLNGHRRVFEEFQGGSITIIFSTGSKNNDEDSCIAKVKAFVLYMSVNLRIGERTARRVTVPQLKMLVLYFVYFKCWSLRCRSFVLLLRSVAFSLRIFLIKLKNCIRLSSKTALQKILASISLNVVKKVMNDLEHFPIWKKNHKWRRADFQFIYFYSLYINIVY